MIETTTAYLIGAIVLCIFTLVVILLLWYIQDYINNKRYLALNEMHNKRIEVMETRMMNYIKKRTETRFEKEADQYDL